MIDVSEHAKERFKQRYSDIELPNIDYLVKNGVKQNAINRKGHIVKNENKGIYRTVYNDIVIEFVKAKRKDGKEIICTFNCPPKSFDEVCFSYRKGEKDER